MKPFLVDVPVKINIWIRPEFQKQQWDVIKEARPSILFIQSDGGRNEDEWAKINQNREMIDSSIDWDCKVYRLYEDKNNGLYAMMTKINNLIWSKVDRCIFTEDDQIPSISFFKFCAEMLEKYKNDERIECICGFNHLGIYDKTNKDYFFSKQGSIWGIATWKRTYENRSFDYITDSYTYNLLKKATKHNKAAKKQLINYGKNELYDGHIPGTEFWIQNHMYSQNRLQIIPKKNLIKNIGASSNSEHSNNYKYLPKSLKKLFNMPIYELDFPLKHNGFVIPDTYYEKKRNRILGKGYPLIKFYHKLIQVIKMIFYGDFKQLFKKIGNMKRAEK